MDLITDIVGVATTPNSNSMPTIPPQTVIINERRELYKCYMPFIKGGGLYIPFNEQLTADKVFLTQRIFILFSMLDEKRKIAINGKVVWINKNGVNKGYGISLGDAAPMKALRQTIEANILEFVAKKEPTYTI